MRDFCVDGLSVDTVELQNYYVDTVEVVFQPTAKVIGIRTYTQNRVSENLGGILGSFTIPDGSEVLTDGSWRCSGGEYYTAPENLDWCTEGFDDSEK